MNAINKTSLAAGVAILSVQAHAQSAVTLYGIVDTGIMYVHNSGGKSTQIMMASGPEQGPRFGLKAAEDLGGGMKAIFQLENSFNSANGKLGGGGRMFGRQAYVGLQGDTWGSVTLGRQWDPTVDLVQPIQGDGFLSGYYSTPGDVDNADNSIAINNAVKWTSPSWSGLNIEAMYAFGGVAGSVGSGQTYSGAVSYSHGPFSLAGGYLHIDNGNASLSTRGTSSADSLFNSSVNRAYATARSIGIARAGGNYTFGSVTLGGYYSFSEYAADANSTFTQSQKFHNAEVYVVWQFTPALRAELGYDYLMSSGDSSAKQNQFTIGADYNLSKRTDVYGVAAYAHASGENGAGAAQAVIGSVDIDSGASSQALVVVGIRHRF